MKSEVSILPQQVRAVFARATCLYSRPQIEAALVCMANAIETKLAQTNPIFICVMIGGLVTLGNLLPHLPFPLKVDYLHATRYRGDLQGRDLHWQVKPAHNMCGRTVVVVDDILDGGITLRGIVQRCHDNGATAVYTAVLVDKRDARLPGGHLQADFSAVSVANHYVFGYGMDYKGYLRNAPGIYRVAPEDEA